MRLVTTASFTLLIAAGCSEPRQVLDGTGDLYRPSNMIFGGSGPDAPEHGATVSLHQLTSGGSVYVAPFCSGTLVASDIVVTAAHCVDVSRNLRPKTMPAEKLAIYVGDNPAVDIVSHLYTVAEIQMHADYSSRNLTDDIAILRLASAVTEPVTPVPGLPAGDGFSNDDVGMTVNFAGFGDTELGGSGVKMQVDGALGGLGCSVAGCPSPGDTATQVSYAQGGGGPCFGDSGGPMFVDRGGTVYLGGVTSYGDSFCTVYGVSTRVDAYETWIADFSGVTPPPGDTADTGGGDTGGPPAGTCGDGVCGAGESCDGRDGTLECGDCDGKTNGKPDYRYCYVEGVCDGSGCP